MNTAQDVKAVLDSFLNQKQISDEYWPAIRDAIADDVALDVLETAEPAEWTDDDVRRAVGRVLCRKLGILILEAV